MRVSLYFLQKIKKIYNESVVIKLIFENMTTLAQNFWNISKEEATILIEKYLDLVEDLEDYVAIKNHKLSLEFEYLSNEETNFLESLESYKSFKNIANSVWK